jgi:hypothetical protein
MDDVRAKTCTIVPLLMFHSNKISMPMETTAKTQTQEPPEYKKHPF